MNIGKLKSRIEIYGIHMKSNDLGELEPQEILINKIWAEIIPQTGSMNKRVGTEFAKMTHKIIVRYEAGKAIKNDHYIRFKGRKFDILYVLNPYEANTHLEIFTSEVVE